MRRMLVPLLALALAACAAPETAAPVVAAPPAAEMTPLPPPAQADAGTPVRLKSGNVELDLSCATDADCAVKDVGNCCGTYPMCVNKDSPTDPAGVQAQCRDSGRAGICGFKNIDSCKCVARKCESAGVAMDNLAPVR